MPRVCAVSNEKGGTGKTTVTMGLAAVIAESQRVLAVDIDPQRGGLTWWAEQAGERLPFDVATERDPALLARLRDLDDYDLVLVDTPGSLEGAHVLASVVAAADYVLLPARPAALDLMGVVETIRQVVAPGGVPYRVLLSQVEPRTPQVVDDAFALLDGEQVPHLRAVVRRYVAHERAPLAGLVVTGYGRGPAAMRALDDFRRVAVEVMGEWAGMKSGMKSGRSVRGA